MQICIHMCMRARHAAWTHVHAGQARSLELGRARVTPTPRASSSSDPYSQGLPGATRLAARPCMSSCPLGGELQRSQSLATGPTCLPLLSRVLGSASGSVATVSTTLFKKRLLEYFGSSHDARGRGMRWDRRPAHIKDGGAALLFKVRRCETVHRFDDYGSCGV